MTQKQAHRELVKLLPKGWYLRLSHDMVKYSHLEEPDDEYTVAAFLENHSDSTHKMFRSPSLMEAYNNMSEHLLTLQNVVTQ